MKLIGYFRSSAAYRVRIALNLKGIAVEQTHRYRLDLHAALRQTRLEAMGGELLDERDRRRADADRSGYDADDDEGFPHGSASGCFEGWAASKAGSFMQKS